MDYKILQIIPAPAGLMAHIANEDKTTTAAPVVCLALIEEKGQGCEPFRYVDYMVGMDEIEAAFPLWSRMRHGRLSVPYLLPWMPYLKSYRILRKTPRPEYRRPGQYWSTP